MNELKAVRTNVYTGGRNEQSIVYGNAYGTHNRDSHIIAAFPDGSHIPGGRFVIHSPNYMGEVGTANLSVVLPDAEGTNLMHVDRATNFADDMAKVKDAGGNFKFIGVSVNGSHTCKKDCSVIQCCPIGYSQDASKHNYHPRFGAALGIVTKGIVTVYTETDVSVTDEIFVRVSKVDDADPCQYLGGVTKTKDDGTMPLNMNYKIIANAKAGEALMIELS